MIILSGYFLAPITRHKGYQKYFEGGVEQAYKFCTPLIIIVNSEKQQVIKYGKIVGKSEQEFGEFYFKCFVP